MILDTSKWEYFKLSDLFEILNGKRLTKANMSHGNTPYIGSIDSNNGVFTYIKHKPIYNGNAITVSYNGSIGEAFYQSKPFWATDDVNVLEPKFKLNQYIALFICAVIRQEKYRFSYGRKWNTSRMELSEIKLPATPDDKPDFEFMENYIKSLQSYEKLESVENIKESINNNKYDLNIEKWKYFKLTDIFEIQKNNKNILINKTKTGNTPLISSTAFNNGIIKYINYKPTFIEENLITISKDGSIGECFYQNKPFCATSHVIVLKPKFKLNKYIILFICTIIKQEKSRYNFGRAWNGERFTNTEIKLPATPDDKPDFEFMENYIKSLPYSKSL